MQIKIHAIECRHTGKALPDSVKPQGKGARVRPALIIAPFKTG